MSPGIYPGVPMETYLALKALSSGMCHTLNAQSPFHAWFDSPFNPQQKRDDSATAEIGEYAHAMLLEGGTDKLEIVDVDMWTKKAMHNGVDQVAHKHRTEIRQRGKLPILAPKVPEVTAMVAAAKMYLASSAVSGILDNGDPEATLIWEQDGVLCKARPDWLSATAVLHYKTTLASVSPRAFSRIVESCGYDSALMFYMLGIEALDPDRTRDHYILAQEQSAPWACKLFDLGAAAADIAERKVRRAIATWKQCAAAGKWPLYDGSVHSIEATPWALAQAEEDMLTDGELKGGIPA